jgi:hypothetical protein
MSFAGNRMTQVGPMQLTEIIANPEESVGISRAE